MLSLFWQFYLVFFLITILILFSMPLLGVIDISLPDVMLTYYPHLLILLFLEGVLAFVFQALVQKPLSYIRHFLTGKDSASLKIEKYALRPDEIGALAATAKKNATQADEIIADLISQQRYLASILENLNDGICIVDRHGVVRIVNQATKRMFNIPERAVSGQTLVETIRHYKVQELWQECQQKKIQLIMQLETSMNRNYLQCIATPLEPYSEGNILFLFQDITRLHQLEVVRRDFVSNVSHELRTPLTSLKLITETLSDGAMDDPPAQQRFLAQMEKEIDNLTQLVQELLELSRIESGLVPLQKKIIDPCTLLESAANRMQVQAERAGLHFSWDCSEKLPSIMIDEARLEQVLINLIHNAIKFTLPGGNIHVSAVQQAGTIVFAVQDTGIGIPQKDIDRIFERFYKTDRSRSKSGTGLGLSIARHLVQAHQGKIWVESVVNQGSTFYFSIPISH
ncbi:MAG: PAS domain-containing protein [Chloroflexi bacterium]|nr:PAS domain-containing protein [Chloroflexota bacterium]